MIKLTFTSKEIDLLSEGLQLVIDQSYDLRSTAEDCGDEESVAEHQAKLDCAERIAVTLERVQT